jgi:peroxiredoxin
MSLVAYALAVYFALSLGVAGMAKVQDPLDFLKTLKKQRLLPEWSIAPVGRGLPWLEIIIACLLVLGWFQVVVAIVLVGLFAIFLSVKTVLFVTKSDADCGCAGGGRQDKPVDATNVVAATISLLAAVTYTWLSAHVAPLDQSWRILTSVLFMLALGGLLGLWGARRIALARSVRHALRGSARPPSIGGLAVGTEAPLFIATDAQNRTTSLDQYRGQRLLLTFIEPGCPACNGLLKTLQEWERLSHVLDATVLVLGSTDPVANDTYGKKHGIPVWTPVQSMLAAYEVERLPHMFALDEHGVIRARGAVLNIAYLRGMLEEAYAVSGIEAQATPGDVTTPWAEAQVSIASS